MSICLLGELERIRRRAAPMIRKASLAGALVLCPSAVLAAGASAAEFGIVPGSFAVRTIDAEGLPEDLAGSHPDRLQVDFALETEGTSVRDLAFEMPPGFGGNPKAVPECPRETFEKEEECPPESQVGTIEFVSPEGQKATLPIFQLEPAAGEFAAFGSKPGLKVPLAMELRPDDFGITFKASELEGVSVAEGHIELWGVPADHQQGTALPRRPFLTTPSRCGPMAFTFRTRSSQEGAPWLSASTETPPLSGCEDLPFKPGLGLRLSNPVADSPTGLQMDLSMPQEEEGAERSSAPIENVTVEMPPGVTVSPGGAEALVVCSDAQFGLGSSSEARCPPSSKVGTAEISSPDLPHALSGDVYLGEEHPGERFRLLIDAPGPGAVIKVVGALHADSTTGRLSTVLKDLPQVSIQRLSLNIDGGPQALLASPLTCGPTTAVARFEPYGGGASVESSAAVTIEPGDPASQCTGAPFAPELVTASSRPQAGRLSVFSATLRRRPGEQLPRRFSVTLPAGLSPALGTVQACAGAGEIAPLCPIDSRIGSVLGEVGSGTSPAALRGNVYLTGPYHRAPFGLLMEFRATIGTFDLGTTAVRAAAQVNSRTGRVTVATDQLPEVVEGVPIRFQAIELKIDRPGLTRNPTSCAPGSTDAAVEAQGGALANVTSTLKWSGCDRLGFRPRIQIALAGRKGLRKHGSPTLQVSARLRPKDTNLRAMKLSLPSALRLDISDLKEICSRRDAAAGACPDASRVGTATARTPLLSKPLGGSIYIVQPSGDGLPDLSISLGAMGVHVALTGRTSTQDGHLVTNLVGLPDMPFSAFKMRLGSGGDGVFSLADGQCAHGRPRLLFVAVAAKGQDGAQRRSRVPIEMRARCRASGSPARAGGRRSPSPTDPR